MTLSHDLLKGFLEVGALTRASLLWAGRNVGVGYFSTEGVGFQGGERLQGCTKVGVANEHFWTTGQ